MDRQQRFQHRSQPTHAHLGCVPNEGNQARNSNLLQFLNCVGIPSWRNKYMSILKEKAYMYIIFSDMKSNDFGKIPRFMNKVSHFAWWCCLRSLSPEYAQEAVTLVFISRCCNLELCLIQLLRNTVDNLTQCPVAWHPGPDSNCMDWLALPIVSSLTCLHFCASKRLENAGSHKKAAVGAGKLMHGLHEWKWRSHVPKSGTLVFAGLVRWFWTAWTSCLRMSCGWPWSPNSP